MKKLLGELLIENKLITQEQLDEALKIQRKDGDLLGAILVNLGYLDDDILLDYLKMQGAKIKMHNKN
jgi:type IV pilus assembly protein PilB